MGFAFSTYMLLYSLKETSVIVDGALDNSDIGARLLFFMLLKSALLRDLYLLTSFVRLKHLAMQTCFYHLSPYIFSIAGAILKGGYAIDKNMNNH